MKSYDEVMTCFRAFQKFCQQLSKHTCQDCPWRDDARVMCLSGVECYCQIKFALEWNERKELESEEQDLLFRIKKISNGWHKSEDDVIEIVSINARLHKIRRRLSELKQRNENEDSNA